jgi:polyisoprenoid-binding protein YceI
MWTRVFLRSLLLVSVWPAPAAGQRPASLPQRFEIDRAHSLVGFSVRFMGVSRVRGAFGAFGGSILYFADRPERSTVNVIILTRSINTNTADRDRHLRSPDFLDVDRYPYITFRSTAVRRTPTGFVAEGDFSLHGIRKTISLSFTMAGPPVPDAWGNSRLTLEARYQVSRKEYGIRGTAFWNSEFDPGRMAVGDVVEIELLVSAVVANPEKWTDRFGDSLLGEIRRQGTPAVAAQIEAEGSHLDSLGDFSFIVPAEKLRRSGDTREAATLYDALVALRPGSPAIALRAGEVYLTLGDTGKARTMFEQVRQADSTDTAASEWLRFLGPGNR